MILRLYRICNVKCSLALHKLAEKLIIYDTYKRRKLKKFCLVIRDYLKIFLIST